MNFAQDFPSDGASAPPLKITLGKTPMWLSLLVFCAVGHSVIHAREAVVLLHGLARTSRSMDLMQSAFTEAGYIVLNLDYPSRKQSIETLSCEVVGGALADPRLQGCTRIHFVAHSLGCILVRSYFERRDHPRLGRVVMLGPPNQGSEVVDRLGSWRLFRRINGPAGAELGTGTDSFPATLGPVKFELGVVAGDRTINWLNSMMIDGPDDGKVSIERTRVEGMMEHLVVHVSHPYLMRDKQVIAAALCFVRSGSFPPKMPNKSPEPTPTAITHREAGAQGHP